MSDEHYVAGTWVDRWTHAILRWRWLVIVAWVATIGWSIAAATQLPTLLTNRFPVPGSEYERSEALLQQHFNQRSDGSFTIVLHGTAKQLPAMLADAQRVGEQASRRVPKAKLTRVTAVSKDTVMAVVSTPMESRDARVYTKRVRAIAHAAERADTQVYVTGSGPITFDIEPVNQEDLERGELHFGLPVATVIVLLVFGTFAFLLPIAFAVAVLPATLGVVWIFAHHMELSIYITNMVLGIGLGVSIDYSLLIHNRYREERAAGHDPETAIVRTMATAGRAVLFSGTAVAIGLAVLLFLPLPFLRGFGIAGLTVPLVSMLCTMTLLPVLILLFGDRLDRVRLVPKRWLEQRASGQDNGWARQARRVMRHAWPYAIGATIVLLAAAAPLTQLELSPGSEAGFPQRMESIKGLEVLKREIGEGAMAPVELVIDTGRKGGARNADVQSAMQKLLDDIDRDKQVAATVFFEPPPPACQAAASRKSLRPPAAACVPGFPFDDPQYVDPTGRYLHAQVVNIDEYGKPASMQFVRRLRADIVPAADFPKGAHVYTGGAASSGIDFLDVAYDAFPWLIVAVLVLTYVLLLRAFRSLLLPLKAIVLNLLSIGAAYGLIVLAFKYGYGEWAGLHHVSQVEGWIPIFLFAMVFGLSMDYEVFLVSRMREAWDTGETNERAVEIGLARTGRLVTAAGLIMVAAFGGFTTASFASIQQLGFGLAAAVLIDVTIVRMFLLPAAMKLFGRWNWWLPVWAARIARVEPSPLQPAPQGDVPS